MVDPNAVRSYPLDFTHVEFEDRLKKLHQLMQSNGCDALFITTEAEFRYFTGFRSLFWQSPARGWYLIIPLGEKPIAIVPTIGTQYVEQCFIGAIYPYNAPAAEIEEIPILKGLLSAFQNIATPKGAESSLRMPLLSYEALDVTFSDATAIIQELRMVKSAEEIHYISEICAIARDEFLRARQWLTEGMTLKEVFSTFKAGLIKSGAEEVPYLVGGAAQDGYRDVISPPTDYQLKDGDILMLDTGATKNGYFCDFDRNFAIGTVSKMAKSNHDKLIEATQKGIEMARPGVRCCDVYHEMTKVLGGDSDIGRIGHGLGMLLTEWPSIAANDKTVLKENMVMTIEPSIAYGDGLMMVHEENIIIGRDDNHLLSATNVDWQL